MMRKRGYFILLTQLLAYGTVFIVPLLLVSVLSYRALVVDARTSILNAHNELVLQLKRSVEQEFHELRNVVLQVQENPSLAAFRVKHDLVAGRTAIENLKNYALPNTFIRNLFLYYRGGKYLYSDQGTFLPRIYINHIHRFERWSPQEFLFDINNLASPRIKLDRLFLVQDGTTIEAAIYMVPLPIGATTGPPAKVVYVVVDLGRLNAVLNELAAPANLPLTIMSADGALIAKSENVPRRLADRMETASREDRHDSLQGHIVLEAESTFPPWRYTAILPQREIITDLPVLQRRFLTIVGFVLAVGTIIVIGMARLTYRPIKMLRIYAEQLSSVTHEEKNELETVRAVLDDVVRTADQYETAVRTSRAAVQERLLREVLSGQIRGTGDLRGRPGSELVHLDGEHFFVAIVHVTSRSSARDHRDVAAISRSARASDIDVNVLDPVDRDSIILLCSSRTDDPTDVARRMEGLYAALAARISPSIAIGVGTCKRSLREMPASYREAKVALDFRHAGPPEDVVLYSDLLPARMDGYRYPTTALEELGLGVYAGEIGRAEAAVDAIAEYVTAERPPVFLLRQLCYDVVSVLNRMVSSEDDQQYFPGSGAEEMLTLTDFDHVDEVIFSIRKMVAESSAYRSSKLSDQAPDRRASRILHYIRTHYADADFTAQRVAEEFGISLSGLTRVVKSHKDMTLTEYVSGLRIGKAKRLLKATDLTFEEITHRVGYFNTSSFTRKFREQTGSTPSVYRKASRAAG
jgi:AraC-like DNA-binding protein